MSFDPMDTQTIKRLATKDITGWLLATLVAVIAWIGSSLITRVDTLTESFNAYELKMENRINFPGQRGEFFHPQIRIKFVQLEHVGFWRAHPYDFFCGLHENHFKRNQQQSPQNDAPNVYLVPNN